MIRRTTGNYAPGSYHAGDACRSRFQSLAQQLTQYINTGNRAGALQVLDTCSERREEFALRTFGQVNDNHAEAIRLIRNVYRFIESNPLPLPITVRFVDGPATRKNFQFWNDQVPLAAIFSRFAQDSQGNQHPFTDGGRRRKSTRKQRKNTRKHRKTRRHR